MTTALADQEPWWEPGTAHGYHVNTFGFLVGEVIRRLTGSTVGTLLRDEIAGPLGADVHIGLPASEHTRVATFVWPGSPPAETEPPGLEPAQLMEHNAYFNPSGLSGAGVVNSPALAGRGESRPPTRTAPPAASPASTRRLAGGPDGTRPSSIPPPWPKPSPSRRTARTWCCTGRPGSASASSSPSPNGRSAPARRRSAISAPAVRSASPTPDSGIAFGYVMNQMGPRWQNPRTRALVDAVYACP